jgi:methionine sulfoxide reductase heme-binding subunit
VNVARATRLIVFAAAATPGAILALDFAAGMLATPYRTILHETGLWSMRLLSLGLLLSPLARVTGSALFNVPRRMLGLFAASYAFVHGWAWCRQYGYDWSFLLDELWRLYLALGLAAVLLLVPLTATSNAWARARLGAAWARLHQIAYAIALLALLHFMLSRPVPPRESLLHLALIAIAVIHRVWPARSPPAVPPAT